MRIYQRVWYMNTNNYIASIYVMSNNNDLLMSVVHEHGYTGYHVCDATQGGHVNVCGT